MSEVIDYVEVTQEQADNLSRIALAIDELLKDLKQELKQLENPFDRSSALNQSAYNGFELARLKIQQILRRHQ